MSAETRNTTQVLSLPQGGGAIKGIGETFQPNLFTGTGNFSIPIYASPGREGFGPQLTLQYSTGNGNGPFGLGWQLSIPRITRKTEKGLPTYTDDDVFVMSGAEDLVPQFKENNTDIDTQERSGYTITRYRPRTEGLFARIEKWEHNDGDIHWRAITKDNVTSLYGKTENARIFDPDHPERVYEWLLQETFDAKGNHILYEYARERDDLALDSLSERNRRYGSQRYIRRIFYGNVSQDLSEVECQCTGTDHVDPFSPLSRRYVFELLFDYGDLSGQPYAPYVKPTDRSETTTAQWPVRSDPFSHFRAGFEVRTLRRCERVLMFHHFPELGGATLVKSTDFKYAPNPDTLVSFLEEATLTGYVRENDVYRHKGMPPITFRYSEFQPHEQRYQPIRAVGGDMPAFSLGNPDVALVDLDGNGLPDVLHTTSTGFRYWKNLGDGQLDRPRSMPQIPAGLRLSQPGVHFADMAGDGRADLLVLSGPTCGFYETTPDGTWETFRRFESLPLFDLSDPNARLLDLTGDGLTDVLRTNTNDLVWYRCLGEAGYDEPRRVGRVPDDDDFAGIFFDDPAGRVRLADMTGDGLNDIVWIHSGSIDYWPNLGYGRFGKRVTMVNAPKLEQNFDPSRLFLADIDGSGCADLVYVDFDRVHFAFNRSGNGWSDMQTIHGTPATTDAADIQFADIFGTGMATLLWSYNYGQIVHDSHYKALDFCGGVKPYILVEMSNNMGATTRVRYAPSTQYWLDDEARGEPWATKLPFPVQVVDKVKVIDHISKTKLVTTYKYHHGYFDGREREFRGFGRVDHYDTEFFDSFERADLHDEADEFVNKQRAYHVPPVLTKTWFHTGVYLDRERVSRVFAGEYYCEPDLSAEEAQALLLPDTVLPPNLTLEEEREACRALKGSMLRQEVCALDSTDKEECPYTVTEQNFTIKRLQSHNGNRHAVFLTHPREAISYHYERNPADPRIAHTMTLEVDDFGNVLRSFSVGYPRADVPRRQPKQNETHITVTINRVANCDDQLDWYRVGLPVESRTYEVVKPPTGAQRFAWEELSDLLTALIPLNRYEPPQDRTIPYEQWNWRKEWDPQSELGGLVDGVPTNTRLRLIEHIRTLYRKDDLTGFLPLGKVQSLALPGETYKLAFTPGLLSQTYLRPFDAIQPPGSPQPEKLLPNLTKVLPIDPSGVDSADRGGYVNLANNGHWWIPSGLVFYAPDTGNNAAQELAYAQQHFFLPHRYRDPFHTEVVKTESFVSYDEYDLLVVETRDALENRITAGQRNSDPTQELVESGLNYRVLQPWLVMDPNRNCSEVKFDALGMVVGTAVMGKPKEVPRPGDSLDGFDADPEQTQIDDFYNAPDPHVLAPALLKNATTRIIYDLERFQRTQKAYPKDPTQWQPVYAATLARETHVSDPLPPDGLKIQLSFSYSDGFGREIQKKIQAEPEKVDGVPGPPRWVGSGLTIFNNKGKPVRQYEPFFSATHRFEFGVQEGVSPIIFYDPLERAVATLHPNHTYEKIVFDPWQQTTYDVNDTIKASDNLGNLPFDPKDDKNVGHYFELLPDDAYLPTWYDLRTDDAKALEAWPDDAKHRASEKRAAEKASVHSNTPTEVHLDVLGRAFLTITHNKFERKKSDGTIEIIKDPPYHTRIELDIEGNQRAVIDARDRVVMRYTYTMVGPERDENGQPTNTNLIHQASMEAGERWMLNDVTGKPIRAWDSRGSMRRMTYDALRRPLELFVTEKGTERLAEHTVYGESQGDAKNHRTRVWQVFDGAGIVINENYDFKGNVLKSTRDLLPGYKQAVNWLDNPVADYGQYSHYTTYDALNRPIAMTTPDDSIYCPTYNEANLLEKVDVNLHGAADPNGDLLWTPFVINIDYNAKGQRTLIEYGCGAGPDQQGTMTIYEYDQDTYRLVLLKTTRLHGLNGLASQLFANATVVQDLHYTYDPAGNITSITDAALKSFTYNNQNVEPVSDYTYDSLYRLIEAKGREHIGQTAFNFTPPNGDYRDYPFVGHRHPNALQTLRKYTESYVYDAVGNFTTMHHAAKGGTWTRHYDYEQDSLIDASANSNRLTQTRVGNGYNHVETYSYTDDQGTDIHGCMTSINSMKMRWDFKDQLQQVDLGGGGTAYYVYDANGQRVRKVIESQRGKWQKERLYLGGFEVYREFAGAREIKVLERETLHIMDNEQRLVLIETKIFESRWPNRRRNRVREPQPLIRYQLGDHLGSACLELDAAARVISYEEYTPYGSTAYQVMQNGTEVSRKQYRFTGNERDEESGLYYHLARYYASWIGKWTSADRVSIKDSNNLYVYVNGNPVRRIDLIGTQSDDINDVVAGANKKLDQPGNPFQQQGNSGLKTIPLTMDIDEPLPVGQKGISPTEARIRAMDVNNRQFLDPRTNRLTKYLGVNTNSLSSPKPPVSLEENPNALLTRKFSEVTELRDVFNEALGKIKDPNRLSPTTLKNRINRNIWEIIKSGKSEAAVKVRAALEKLGFKNIKGKGYVLSSGAVSEMGSIPLYEPGPVVKGIGKAMFFLALIHGAYSISTKTTQTYCEQGATMAVAQAGKTTAKFSTGLLWGAAGGALALTLFTGGLASPLLAAAGGALVTTGGIYASDQLIDQATPQLR